MTPFILQQHSKDSAAVRELRDSEIDHVAGGYHNAGGGQEKPIGPINLDTCTVSLGGDVSTDTGD